MQMFRFGRQIHNLTAEKNLLKKKERRGKLIVTETEIKQQKTPKHCRGHKLLLKYRHSVRVMKIKQAKNLKREIFHVQIRFLPLNLTVPANEQLDKTFTIFGKTFL